MVKSLYTGVTGMKTHQQRMDIIGNNIANVNTVGFKAGVVTFSDVYYQTKKSPSGTTSSLGAVNPRQVGYGVQMNTATPNMSQSGFTFTDSVYDMAIDGEGFFQLMDGSGRLLYTRLGAFSVDPQGYLVNAAGYHVLGVSGNSEGQPASSEIIRITVPATNAKTSSATKKISGTNVTISVSQPSDNTDMSVTFTQADYPFATYANGILNIFFDMTRQYESDDDFERAITEAINAGGITLPDGVEIKFDFETVPSDPEAKIASNSISGWPFSTTQATAEGYWAYEYTDPNAADATPVTQHAQLAFSSSKEQNDDTVTFAVDANADATGVEYANGAWTITICSKSTMAEINKAIEKYIEEQAEAGTEVPNLRCTKFVMPSDIANREAAINAIANDNNKVGFNANNNNLKLTYYEEAQIGVDAVATVAGAYANDYKITFAYSASYGKTKAVWDENNLTITICNDTTLDDINKAIIEAAAGNDKKVITLSGLASLGDMNPAAREALFGKNPAFSLGEGDDSFYTKVAKALTTFGLIDGRTGEEQSYSNLTNITVQSDGTIIGYHSVHGYMTLGRVDIVTFDNPNGLTAISGSTFMESVASGSAKVHKAGDDGAGEIVSNALEMSNVDLAQEFTDMITTQRGYQANSRVITTSDTMLEELLSLKR